MTRKTKPKAGRPPLHGEPMKRVNVMLRKSDLELARALTGNVSEAIRRALALMARAKAGRKRGGQSRRNSGN